MSHCLSIVVPCYNEGEILPQFLSRTEAQLQNLSEKHALFIEMVLVDDGSTDETLSLIKMYALDHPDTRYLSFSRNFGKESAMLAGMRHAKGDLVVIMDADLQHPPELLDDMVKGITLSGYDCVATRITRREGENWIRSVFSDFFYRLHNRLSNVVIVPGAKDFRMMTRQMVDAILSMPEYNRFSKGIFSWVGFKTLWLEMESYARPSGTSKWSFRGLTAYALDGITAFSTAPLQLASWMGLVFCLFAILLIGVVVVKTLIWGEPVAGFPTLISAVMFLGGVQLFSIGVLGQYMARTYLETKGRPQYIIREAN